MGLRDVIEGPMLALFGRGGAGAGAGLAGEGEGGYPGVGIFKA